jgi:hypothetical protein
MSIAMVDGTMSAHDAQIEQNHAEQIRPGVAHASQTAKARLPCRLDCRTLCVGRCADNRFGGRGSEEQIHQGRAV